MHTCPRQLGTVSTQVDHPMSPLLTLDSQLSFLSSQNGCFQKQPRNILFKHPKEAHILDSSSFKDQQETGASAHKSVEHEARPPDVSMSDWGMGKPLGKGSVCFLTKPARTGSVLCLSCKRSQRIKGCLGSYSSEELAPKGTTVQRDESHCRC